MLRGEKSWTCSMSKIGERCLRTRAVNARRSWHAISTAPLGASARTASRQTSRGSSTCSIVCMQLMSVNDSSGRTPALNGSGRIDVADARRGRGQRRLGGLEADRLLEPRVAQSLQERAVARADVGRAAKIGQLRSDRLDDLPVGRRGVPGLLAARVVRLAIRVGQGLEGRDGARVEEVARAHSRRRW